MPQTRYVGAEADTRPNKATCEKRQAGLLQSHFLARPTVLFTNSVVFSPPLTLHVPPLRRYISLVFSLEPLNTKRESPRPTLSSSTPPCLPVFCCNARLTMKLIIALPAFLVVPAVASASPAGPSQQPWNTPNGEPGNNVPGKMPLLRPASITPSLPYASYYAPPFPTSVSPYSAVHPPRSSLRSFCYI